MDTIKPVPEQKPWPITLVLIPQPTFAGEQPTTAKPWAGTPSQYRLRKALKHLLRQHGLRCVDIRTHHPDYGQAEAESLAASFRRLLGDSPKLQQPRAKARKAA